MKMTQLSPVSNEVRLWLTIIAIISATCGGDWYCHRGSGIGPRACSRVGENGRTKHAAPAGRGPRRQHAGTISALPLPDG